MADGSRRNEATPEPADADYTSRYEGEELRHWRSKRPTEERVARLEAKHDDLVKVVTETRVVVGEMSGKLDVLPQLVSMVRQQADRAVAQNERRQTLHDEDELDAKKHKRQRMTQVIGWALSGGVAIELLHLLARYL